MTPRAPRPVLFAVALLLPASAAPIGLAQPETPEPATENEATRGNGIGWMGYVPAAFRRAQHDDRLMLLVLDMPWSGRSAEAKERLWSDQELVKLIDERFVPVRERADLHPGLARRYPAPGLPAISQLLPDGTPLALSNGNASGTPLVLTTLDPDRLAAALREADGYYRQDRKAAVEASRESLSSVVQQARPRSDKAEPSAALSAAGRLESAYDAERRYFGGAPRVPRLDAIELLLRLAREDPERWRPMAVGPLRVMLQGLIDPEDGGLRSLARGLDWEDPVPEKLLEINARALELTALAQPVADGEGFTEPASQLAEFLTSKLGRPSGGFATAVAPACPEGRCGTVLSGDTGLAAAALIRAGRTFGEKTWIARGLEAARFLEQERYRKRRGVVRAVVDGFAVPPGNILLEDLAGVAWGFMAAYEATGEASWREAAEDVLRTALENLADGESGVLGDRLVAPNAPTPLRAARFPVGANARVARCLLRLSEEVGAKRGRMYRVAAERILSGFAGSARRMDLDERAAFGAAAWELGRRDAPKQTEVGGDRRSEQD